MKLKRKKNMVWGMSLCLVLFASGAMTRYAEGNTVRANTIAATVNSQSIKDKKDEISKINDQKQNLQDGLTDLKEIKEDLEKKKSDMTAYVQELDNSLVEIEQHIEELKGQITDKEAEIEKTQKDLDAAVLQQDNQKDAMYTRVRLMYENGDAYMVEMFMKAANFGDFLNSADYMEKVMEYDRQKWLEFKDNAEYIELCWEQLEVDRIFLDQAKLAVEQEQTNVEELIEQKSRDITAFESDIQNKDQAIKEYEASIRQQDAEIAALEKAIAEETRRILEGNGSAVIYDGGTFGFPLTTYTRVSDDYGMRMHPILGVEQFHNGVDFAAPGGTPILAAYNGNVVGAGYSSSMGNYVMIDHGGGLVTIYMHASALYVSAGDSVTKGDTIAAVGSTGRSTGNHLHFSVRQNGSYVSPWNYLSR